MRISYFDSEAFCGYKQITTFWQDFSIADVFGTKAIHDTYNRAVKEWKTNVKYFTELVMVLNWKSWQYANNPVLCELYANAYYKARDIALDTFKGDDLKYFLETTD